MLQRTTDRVGCTGPDAACVAATRRCEPDAARRLPSRPRRALRRAAPSAPRRLLPTIALLVIHFLPASALVAAEVRIKDITDVVGLRSNPLTGMGLVVGLNGTGGKTPATRRFAQNMLQRFGLRADPDARARIETDANQKTNNLSVVVVTADLPPLAREGAAIDVMVSAFDDASSLQGGTLIMTPLLAADGQVYAVASGPISIGGFNFSGDAGSVVKNHPTVGRIPNGATIEREVVDRIGDDGLIRLQLRSPDFETARRIAAEIMLKSPGAARVVDSTVVEVQTPPELRHDVPGFLGIIGGLTVAPDLPARVVINERTGTIIVGGQVRVSQVLITHANLAIMTTESPQVSQPAPFSDGETAIVPRTQVDVVEERAPITQVPDTTTVSDLAQALNALGVAPRDLSSIFQQLKESGALHAELEFR